MPFLLHLTNDCHNLAVPIRQPSSSLKKLPSLSSRRLTYAPLGSQIYDKLDLATPKIVTSKSGTKFYKKLKLQTSGLVGS
ncbi:hypothetical protein F441_03018 [Phytophthora nicotianae CJ01A1]|uniref:Uncharacterized protein n=1 Tax=Phytophthora nicotianae CJ01A1 TaxID=1317063 RepID=W2XN74_PHYNI|nr:hypothetical protein F441_03018 [Phytophthora nicotianae CJ01A1]